MYLESWIIHHWQLFGEAFLSTRVSRALVGSLSIPHMTNGNRSRDARGYRWQPEVLSGTNNRGGLKVERTVMGRVLVRERPAGRAKSLDVDTFEYLYIAKVLQDLIRVNSVMSQ